MLWYSLEAPRRGASNEYHNIRFRGEIRKISAFFRMNLDEKCALSVAMDTLVIFISHYSQSQRKENMKMRLKV